MALFSRHRECCAGTVHDASVARFQWRGMSRDGRCIGFHSDADNLVPADGNTVSDVFVHAPELILDGEPSVVSAGQTLKLVTFSGPPGKPASLWAVKVNGSPIFSLVKVATF